MVSPLPLDLPFLVDDHSNAAKELVADLNVLTLETEVEVHVSFASI